MEGEYEVGMSSISLPPESLFVPHLKRPNDGSIVMKSYRELYINSGHKDTCVVVSYGDIKDTPMTTAYDFLKILFDREYELFLD